MIVHLPADAAWKRAAGHWTHEERILDLIAQHAAARRAEAWSFAARKRSSMRVKSYIGEIERAKAPPPSFDALVGAFGMSTSTDKGG